MVKKKNDETPPETVSEKAETHGEASLEQHGETPEDTENYLNTTMLNEMIHLRVDGHLSMRQIAEKTGVSLATVSRILKGVDSLDASEEDEEKENDEEDTDIEIDEEPSLKISTQVPEGYVLRPGITPEQFAKFSKMKKEELVAQLVESESERTSLRSQVQLRKGDGEEQHSKYVEPPLTTRETIQYAQTQKLLEALTNKPNEGLTEDKIERIVERAIDKHGNLGFKDVLPLAEFLAKQNRSEGPSQLDLYRAGRMDESKVQAQVSNANNPTPKNEYDLKLESVRQEGQIQNRQLEWEMQKYSEGKADTREIYGLAKEVIKGPVETLIKGLGGAAADRIRGHVEPPKVISISCPGCHKPFNVVEGSRQVVCPGCNAVLQLNQPSKAPPEQPQPNPIPETPQQQETETPIETETPNEAAKPSPGA